ncbi:MAG: APC family permease [Candidatus Methanofastidiosa archaeon]|nr:APC family permease [Candidatus Methanofastidiosa archaeon]
MSTSKAYPKSSEFSQNNIDKISALFLTSGMMVGTGIFNALGAATQQAQSGILLSMFIDLIIVLLTALSTAQVGINYPEEGGAFIWMRIFGYPTISFVEGVSYFIRGIVGLGIVSLGFATYSALLFPGIPVKIVASIALLVVAAINFFGISPTSKVVIGIFFANLLLLLVYVAFSIPNVKIQNLTPVLGTSVGGIFSGATTFFWSWDGFQRTAIMANEIKEPRKTIPFAMIGGILITAAVYFIIAGVTLGVLGPSAVGKSDTPLFIVAKKTIVGLGMWVVLPSAWILSFSDLVSNVMSTSKVGHSMGEEHEFPHSFGTIHKKLKSPQFVIIMFVLVALILVNVVPLRKLLTIANVCIIIWYIGTHLSALKLNKEQQLIWPIVPWLGLVTCIALLFSLPIWSLAGAFCFIVILTCVRLLITRVNQKFAIDTDGVWTVSGLTLAQGDIISVTAQYAGEKESKKTKIIVSKAPSQTTAPLISRTVSEADTLVMGKAPSGANVVFCINGTVHTAVTATGGNWVVSGLTLVHSDFISVTAQSIGEIMSLPTTTTVIPAPEETVAPTILGTVTSADKTISGNAAVGASVVLCINGKAEPAVIAANGNWSVTGLNLSQGDIISVNAKYDGEIINTSDTKKVVSSPIQTGEPIISGLVNANDTTVSGRAPTGARIILRINGAKQPPVISEHTKQSIVMTTSVTHSPDKRVSEVKIVDH